MLIFPMCVREVLDTFVLVDMQMSKTTKILVLGEDSVVGGEEEPMRRQAASDIPTSERIIFFKQPSLFIIYTGSQRSNN